MRSPSFHAAAAELPRGASSSCSPTSSPRHRVGLDARPPCALDVVPVIVQDPTWEQSFPPVHVVLIPFPSVDGEEAPVRLTAAEAAHRRDQNEKRLEKLLARFRRLDFDPFLLGTAEPETVDAAFLRWAERRRRRRRRR